MQIYSTLKHSIFLRIYAGLLLVCLVVVVFAQILMTTINKERVGSYSERMATGAFYVVAEGIAHHPDPIERQHWLSDASNLFGETFRVIEMDKIDFASTELKKLNKQKSVVRTSGGRQETYIYYRIPGENNVVTVKIKQVSEQQVRALAIFLLDDLSNFRTLEEKTERLATISNQFGFPIQFANINDVDVDADQRVRLRRSEVVVHFRDSASVENSAFIILVPTEINDTVIRVGPIQLFNWYPLNLIISVILISMFLISLGVYALIFPLERKLQLVQVGLNNVTKGKLNTRVEVVGQDEISRLSATFNSMVEHIKRLIESQRELTRAVSHELRTPVARIRFAVDMLADTDDAESREMQRDYIDKDIEALNGLIDEILTYAKLEEGSPKLDWEMVNLSELITQIVKETNALGKPIEVISEVSHAKARAMADRRYLHRVVQNLAGNALRYANGKIKVSAGVAKGRAYVTVEDDGQGIPEADRDKVFIPFSRLDDSRTRASGGYGLGLSIVSRIAFWFNGEISVNESPELGGAKFTMTWPVKQLNQTIAADELTQEVSAKKIITDTK